jgi:hypothetical protein
MSDAAIVQRLGECVAVAKKKTQQQNMGHAEGSLPPSNLGRRCLISSVLLEASHIYQRPSPHAGFKLQRLFRVNE